MGVVRIQDLTAATTPLGGTEIVEIEQGGESRKVSAQDIADLGGGASAVPVQEEGSTVVASPTAINFVGAGVTASASGSVATVTIPGGGLSNPMTTAGDIITGGASGTPQRLAVGTNTQVLTVVAGAPAWAAAPSGGGGGSWDTVAVWPSDNSYVSISPPTQVGAPFSFTPDANATYEVEAILMIASGLTTTAARMGFLWPSGVTRGAVRFSTPTSTTVELVDSFDWPASANPEATATTSPSPNGSYHVYTMRAIFRTDASPGGNARLTLSTNNAGAVITLSAGSIMRWKKH